MNDRTWIEDLKSHVDCRDIAEWAALSRRGNRYFCPYCQPNGGKSPDLSIKQEYFKCFKCDNKGDAIRFVSLCKGLDFKRSVELLASIYNVDLPEHWKHSSGEMPVERKPFVPNVRKEEDRELPIEDALEIYQRFLDVCQPIDLQAYNWLEGKGIDPKVAQRSGVCISPLNFSAEYHSELGAVFPKWQLKASGLSSIFVYEKHGIDFLVFPYYDQGRPVYLKVRHTLPKDDEQYNNVPRFLNIGKYVPVPYAKETIERGIDIHDHTRVFVCEGETDALAAISRGINACGIPGYGAFKEEWVVPYFGTYEHVYLAFDGDSAGQEGAEKVQWMFIDKGIAPPVTIKLPPGYDLSDWFSRGQQ